tara:strand:+ start:197 stop:403 length:207 start_codon:yes stop_codon:yes gene_type:complete
MQFLLDRYNRAPKGDGFRPPSIFTKYVDQVAALNAANFRNLKASDVARITRTTPQPRVSNPSSTLPGS